MYGMSEILKSWSPIFVQDETRLPRAIVNACSHTALTALIDGSPKISAAVVESIAGERLSALLKAWGFIKDSGKQAFVGAVVTKQGPDGMKAKCIEAFYKKIENLTVKALLHCFGEFHAVLHQPSSYDCTSYHSGMR
jgi:hypothetical protein